MNKRPFFFKMGLVMTLIAAFVGIGMAKNAQAAAQRAAQLLISNHAGEDAYKTLRGGQKSGTQKLAAIQHQAKMPAALDLPATIRNRALNPVSSTATASNLLPSGRWTAIGPTVMDTDVADPFYLFNYGPNSGRIVGVAPDPNVAGVIYIAAAGGGVWKTVNDGASWVPLTDTMPTLEMGALAMDPNNSQILYAATGENNHCGDCAYGLGIYKTVNGGASWTILNAGGVFTTVPGYTFKFNVIKVDPNNSAHVWAGSNKGLFYSADAGATWNKVVIPIAPATGQISDVIIDSATNPSTLIVADNAPFTGDAASGVFKSINTGATWTDITPAVSVIPDRTKMGITRIALAKSNHLVMYMIAANPNFDMLGTTYSGINPSLNALVYKTVNGGTTWTSSSAPNVCNGGHGPGQGQCFYDIYASVDPANANIAYIGGVNIGRTTDGTNWTDITTVYDATQGPVHPDQHDLKFGPVVAGQPTPLYAVNDGGIYKSTDTGTNWKNLNTNLQTAEVYVTTAGTNFANQRLAWAGMQDNGSNKYTGNTTWNELYGGDGGYTAVDPTDQRVVYEEYVYLGMSKTTDGGASWTPSTTGIPNSAYGDRDHLSSQDIPGSLFIAPFIIDPTPANHLHLLAGADAVFETIDGANNWCQISQVFGSGSPALGSGTSISFLTIAPSTSALSGETIYAGLQDGTVFKTTVGYINHTVGSCPTPLVWTEADSGITPAGFVAGMAVDPANAQNVYLTTSVNGNSTSIAAGPHSFKSSNGGTSWTSMDGTGATALPNINVNAIIAYSTTTGIALVVGTDQGIYLSGDNGATWSSLSTGLPNAPVNSLNMDFAKTTILASTHSRGVFAMPIPQTDVSQGTGDTVGIFNRNFTTCGCGEYLLRNSLTSGGADINIHDGVTADLPVVGDWDGQGTTSVGVYRPGLSKFILKDSNAPLAPITHTIVFGTLGDIPLSGDWTGSGFKSIGLYRPSQGVFYLKNTLTGGFADESIVFGPPNAKPLVGDWNGDGIDTVGIDINGVISTTDAVCLNKTCSGLAVSNNFVIGIATDLPVVGDWLHKGRDTIGVYRPSNGTFYLRYTLSTGSPDLILTGLGTPGSGQFPVAGHWNNTGNPYIIRPPTLIVPGASNPAPNQIPSTAVPAAPPSSFDG